MVTNEKKLSLMGIFAIIVVFALSIVPILRGSEKHSVILSQTADEVFALGDGFVAVGDRSLTAYSADGDVLYSENTRVTACASDGEKLAVFGENIRVYGKNGLEYEVFSHKTPTKLCIYGDYLLVCTDGSDYENELTLYHMGERIFTRYIAQYKLIDMGMTDDGIFAITENLGVSRLLWLDYSSAELYICDVIGTATAIMAENDTICMAFADKLAFFSTKSYEIVEKELIYSAVTSCDGVILVLCPQKLVKMSKTGEVEAEYKTAYGAVRRLISADKPAMLYGEDLLIFDDNLSVKYTLEGEILPKRAILYRNTAVLLWGSTAEIHRK